MKTTIKVSEKKGLILTLLIISFSTNAMAFELGNFITSLSKDISNDGHVSFIIIGSILGFGLLMYMINKFIAKHTKNDEGPSKISRQSSHRHQHHHRIVKKSA